MPVNNFSVMYGGHRFLGINQYSEEIMCHVPGQILCQNTSRTCMVQNISEHSFKFTQTFFFKQITFPLLVCLSMYLVYPFLRLDLTGHLEYKNRIFEPCHEKTNNVDFEQV